VLKNKSDGAHQQKEHFLKCAFKFFPGHCFSVQSISGKLLLSEGTIACQQ
jgi:hypothetical protein